MRLELVLDVVGILGTGHELDPDFLRQSDNFESERLSTVPESQQKLLSEIHSNIEILWDTELEFDWIDFLVW
jgi:hypothetical protein